mgnify:FL=1
MNPKCLTTIFVPMQSLNFNLVPPTTCPTHQKPLSYYNKYKPDKDPICLDCLINEIKEAKDSNLYVPFSNLEQEYYHQKNTFFQIIEKANNIKKYETHINNFQNLLSNYFTKFISKFLKEKISVDNSFQKKVDFCEKKKGPMNAKDIMNILNKVENEKFILDNKCADVFCQINKLQKILLNNNEKLAEAFKTLLEDFFGESSTKLSKEKEYILSKTQSNKKRSNEPDIELQCRTNSSVPSNSSKKNQDFLSSTNVNTKSPCLNEDISQFSINDDLNINDRIKQISNFGTININMQKERIFEENDEVEDEKKNLSENNNRINNSFPDNKIEEINEDKKAKAEKELLKTVNDEDKLEWRSKKNDNNDDIYKDHKEKINQLIEQDKNKKSVNQSFFQSKRPKFKKKQNLNKSFQKTNHSKYAFQKKREYNYYNQFNQKICRVCGESFFIIKSGFNEEEKCDKCKRKIEENENFSHRRLRDFSMKNKKFGFFQKNFGSLLKKPHMAGGFGSKKMFGKKMEPSYNSHYLNRTLIHSNSTYIKQHIRMNSPMPKFGFNPKYRLNKGKENYDDNYIGKTNKYAVHRKYNEKKNDDFEVDLDSGDEKMDNLNENDELNENEDNKSFEEEKFNKTINGFYRDDFREKNSENNSEDNENDKENEKKIVNGIGFPIGDKSNDNSSYKNDLSDKEDNGDNMNNENDEGEDNEFEADF